MQNSTMRCRGNSGSWASSHSDSTEDFGLGGNARWSMKASRRETERRPASMTADTTLSGALLDTPVRLPGRGDRLGPRYRTAGRTRSRPRCAVGGRVEHGRDLHQGCRGGCMDRAALARAPGRRSDVGLAGVASRSGGARGLETSGLGGMVGRDRQQCGDHLLHRRVQEHRCRQRSHHLRHRALRRRRHRVGV